MRQGNRHHIRATGTTRHGMISPPRRRAKVEEWGNTYQLWASHAVAAALSHRGPHPHTPAHTPT
jgi:hypothetical protein